MKRSLFSVAMVLAVATAAMAAKKDTVGMAGMEMDYAEVMNGIAMQGVNPNENAAANYVKAFETYVPEPKEMYKLRLWETWPTEMTNEQRSLVAKWVGANSTALAQLTEGSQKPYFWLVYPEGMPLGAGPLASYRQVGSVADALCWRAALKATDGDFDGAVEDVLAAYRFGNQLVARPHRLWEQRIGFDVQMNAMWTASMLLSMANMDIANIAKLQEQLQAAVNEERFSYDLLADRIVVDEAIDRTFEDGKVSLGAIVDYKAILGLTDAEVQQWQQLDEAQTTAMARRLFVYLRSINTRTPGEIKFEKIDLKGEIDSRVEGNVLLKHFRPDILKKYDMPFRAKTDCQAVITICAVKCYQADHNGQVPPTLKVLEVMGMIKAVPMDPYREHYPLTYVDAGNNFKLYSYGADYKDSFCRPSNWGEGPASGDQVFWPIR